MIFHQIEAGGDRNFAYLLADRPGGAAALFDPPLETDHYAGLLRQHDVNIRYIIITHGHSDHTCGIDNARRLTGAQVVAHASSDVAADVRVEDGDRLRIGDVEIRFLHTPGHSDDAICILAGRKLITGDTLFVGKVGGTDYGDNARKEYHSLHDKLMKLDDDIEVYPGHDVGVEPTSTIGRERRTNPFLLCESFDDFVHLKRNWLQYKKEHGIP